MKIVIASDSFKGSNSSIEVAECIEKGIRSVFPESDIVKIPISDGGEGIADALAAGVGGVFKEKEVKGPLGDAVKAKYAILNNGVGVVEMASASGLTLIPGEKRNPLLTTTYGTGELILAAVNDGCKKVLVGIGGSATNDGGMGAAQALGISFKDADGIELGYGGGELSKLARIDVNGLNRCMENVELVIACDVKNQLTGENGASVVYAPQKGATPEMVSMLDNNLKHYSQIIKEQYGYDAALIPGTGAAGGFAVPFISFLHASISSGIDTVLDTAGFDNHLLNADLVITGEGRIDSQSVFGKVPTGVAVRAKKNNIPVLAIAGGIGEGANEVYKYGIDGMMSIVNCAMPLSQAMAKSSELICDAAERLMRFIKIGMDIND